MPFFNLSDLTWDDTIYPRSARSQKTIEAYSEALAGGAQFPPIIIQSVFNYPAPNTRLSDILLIILDGIHRWSAYKASCLIEIEAVFWQNQPLDHEARKDEMLLEAVRSNIHHGDRLSQTDKRKVARDIVSRDPNYRLTEEMLAQNLGVTRQTVNNWIKDIRARQKASRDSTILRLNRLGWPQQKIAEVVDISQTRVSEIIGNANFCIIDNLIAQGREMPYIAGHLNMDLATAWAVKLTDLSDQEKFKALGWGLRTWNQWNFNDCDDRFGNDWPGRIPAQLPDGTSPTALNVPFRLNASAAPWCKECRTSRSWALSAEPCSSQNIYKKAALKLIEWGKVSEDSYQEQILISGEAYTARLAITGNRQLYLPVEIQRS